MFAEGSTNIKISAITRHITSLAAGMFMMVSE